MLNVFSLSITIFKGIQDSKVGDLGIPNDHATIELLIAISAIKVIRENKIAKVKIDWDLIRSDKGKKRGFNKRLNELNLTTEVPYTPFFENVLRAARDTTTTTIRPIISCFEENADILTPPIEEKHALLSAWRNAPADTKPHLQNLLRKAKHKVADLVATARANLGRQGGREAEIEGGREARSK